MIKKIFILLFLVVIAVYLIIAVTSFNNRSETAVCKGMELVINDSIDYGFITKNQVIKLLNTQGISPIGKEMGSISTRDIEEQLELHPLIENAECYRTPSNKIGIEITQRLPILRIMANNGDDYFLDEKGEIMPIANNAANVAVITGSVERSFASKELYDLGLFMQQNEFWKAQILQINVTPSKELEIVPRVGDHIIFLGKPGNYEEKFEKLETFYKKALNQIGWNKYSRISLEFDNQIICTKKEK